ncbi:flavin-containing monooxygenase [Mycolicibacterium confluentis]|uniref:Monooxygenase n=1 Tax=Mycolicibacterium confluentis TaxID=28047 RepID=A0A7I7Y331_9MYCO|nr:NAD(P)/FAD-dependent oxidoreductase [Mycolicibacterium confluentis]MCV7318127.1 NAD(P)/FAD-dependent oxidoreductase [Mycolicibacterium confluentis]ORV31218.1 4-hydroxyacetophenone monooxygenase [Mycolicibacterium confluentis]BBZ36036.1 monooxygenase [Mycolicibacterium confluentis]
MRNPHAGVPFDTSDAEIAAALEDVSIPTLLLSCVHMSGDPSLLDGPLRPAGLFLNEVQGYMSEEDKAAARALALDIIRDYRDRGCPEPGPVDPALLKRMMEWLVCTEVPDEYVPMMVEEMELDGRDARATGFESDAQSRADFPVVIVGCGQSGLLAAIRLREAGIPFTVIEKNAGVGGTWWENTYPGARVDVGNHFYCYSFEPDDHWTEFFAQQPELQSYFQGVMERHRITEHVRFNTTVHSATWDEAAGTWSVLTSTADGTQTTLHARAVISAVGQLNAPHVPEFPGAERFSGPAFHTARWQHDVDLTGRRVALIGAGATGFQVAPAIADTVKSLTIFQRTAQWMFPNPNYHAAVGPGVRWALRHLPFYGRWYRFLIFWPGCDTGLAAAKVDPDWPDQQRAVSAANDLARMMFTEWIRSQVGDDTDLLDKVIPDYPATGKRTLQDNGSWLRTLTRDNVELVRTPIDHIEPDAVVTGDGIAHPAEILVYATGFRVNDMLSSVKVYGRDGVELHEAWGGRPAAHLGITIPGFPNFFCLYGPGTNLASGGSLIFHSECEVRYVMGCLDHLLATGHRAMEPRQESYDDWYARSQAELATLVWSQPSIKHSFYKDDAGLVHSLSPWRLVDYWTWTRRPDPEDFVFS